MNKTYYIPTSKDCSIAGYGEFCQCDKCGRKILVSMGLAGTIHHLALTATCADCLVVHENFRKTQPQVAKMIDDWKAGIDITEYKQRYFVQDEEIPGANWPLEHDWSRIPGTLTGSVIVDDKIIQTFSTNTDGDFINIAKFDAPENYLKKGSYKSYTWSLEWAFPNPPNFLLRVSYEYGEG
jgi:hypothetical protein